MEFDWSDGSFEEMARQLRPVAERVVARARIGRGERVLDVGCGTGNAALIAASIGASVTGIDPAERLLEVARRRAVEEGLAAEFLRGEAAAPGVPDGTFDVAVAVFSIIFAPDPAAALAGVARALRPGGRLIVTTWVPEGAIHECASRIAEALRGEGEAMPESPWAQESSLRALFGSQWTEPKIARETLPFGAASAKSWFESMEADHPFWRKAREAFAPRPEEYARLREQLIDLLEGYSETRDGFQVQSSYRVVEASLR